MATPTVSAPALDANQVETVTDTIPTTGTAPYSWTWLASTNMGAYATATMCAVDSGSGAAAGTLETCTIAANTLTAGDTYTFEFRVTDSEPDTGTSAASATVTVSAELTAGAVTPTSPTIDDGQTITLTENRAGGAAPHTYQWYSSANDTGACSSGTALGTAHTQAVTPTTDTYYCYVVTDSATTPETASSAWDLVTVDSALGTPSTPTVSATALDVNQALTVTGTIPTGGDPPYGWTWLVSVNGGAYEDTTQCATNGGAGATAGATETCSIAASTLTVGDRYAFELRVTDASQGTPNDETSAASSTVSVASMLTAPGAPTVSATALDLDQTLTVTGTIPSTGTATYAWTWLISVSGGGYATATQCATNSGSGAAAGASETCSLPGDTLTVGSTYNFELKVTDSATGAETEPSAASSTVTVASTLEAPSAPGVSAAKLDVDQSLTITGTIPSTGTSPYSWQWLVEVDGAGGFGDVSAAWCTASGSGAVGGAVETCTIPGGTLTAGDTYSFELQVTDSASTPETAASAASSTVAAASTLTAPAAPTVSSTALDVNQPLTVTGTIPSTGSSTYSWTWLVSVDGGAYATATQCGTNSGSGAAAGATETCSVAASTLTVGNTYNFELKVTDSASSPETETSGGSATVTVSSALTAPAAPGVSGTKLDVNQALTVTGTVPSTGTSSYAWTWLVSVNGGAYGTATQCAVDGGAGAAAGATETCSIPASALTAGDTYAFELEVTDSATTPESRASAASSAVAVASALTAPGAPGVSATTLDANQALTVTGTIPSSGTSTYSWTWLVSVDGGAYATATQCATNSGSGAAAGATETCSVAAGGLTAGDTYSFELKVSDSASSPETETSGASSTVTVSSALTAPVAPTVSATALDVNQALTVTGTVPSTGTAPYGWTWMVSVNGGAYAAATQCAINSGSGAVAGAGETCSIAASTLTVGDTYHFELKVTDSSGAGAETATSTASSTVTVASALTAPVAPGLSATKLDLNQALTVTGTIPSTGTSLYAWAWMVSVNGGGYAAATQCAISSGSGAVAGATETCTVPAGALTAGDTYSFELKVTDSASTAETQTSGPSSTVAVASTLTAPSAPSVTATSLDVNQAVTATGTIPSTGTSTYAWTWMMSVNGGGYAAATQCAVNSGAGAVAGATETCAISAGALTAGDTYAFELKVTDSATSAETQTSGASSTVTVASALTAPGAPTVSASALDLNQALTVSGTLPSTGTAPYSWTWMVSVNGGAYAPATECGVNGGTGASAGATETCSVAAGTLTAGNTYSFELKVSDGASTPETQTSVTSFTVTVASALTASGAPTVSATALDADQQLTVNATIPSAGTAPYAWSWLVSVNGGAYSAATQCTTNSGTGATAGATETCTILANTLTIGDTYSFELTVVDSATAAETQTSAASSTVTVAAALTAPATPTVSATALDQDQALTVTGTIPTTGTSPYFWTWLVSVNGGVYGLATECAVDSGTDAVGGARETCAISAGTLTVGDTYSFELQVSDSETVPETATSVGSSTVVVASALTAPAAPTVGATLLDANQEITVTATLPSTGTSSYGWRWMVSVNGHGFATAAECAVDSGAGAPAGATETCSIAASTLTAGDTYSFELQVSDSATTNEVRTSGASSTVAVASALTAPGSPGVSATSLDANQASTITGTIPSAGTSSYGWTWMVSVNGAAYVTATQCAVDAGTGAEAGATETCAIAADALTAGDTYDFELQVTDSATDAETATSAPSSTMTVSSALTAPEGPGVSAPTLDADQVLTVMGTIPSSGTAPDSWTWMVSVNGGPYVAATQCTTNSGTGATAGATETCTVLANTLTIGDTYSFELTLVDSSGAGPESATSTASPTVTVNSALTAPAAPTVNATAPHVTQTLTVVGTIPSTGTASYAWTWLVSVNGSAYGPATVCAMGSGTGAAPGTTETCSIRAGTLTVGDTYAFKLQVTDSATVAESQTSAASPTVTVAAAVSSSSALTGTSVWVWTVAGAGILVALLLALLVVRRRRRPAQPVDRRGPEGGESKVPTSAAALGGLATLGTAAGSHDGDEFGGPSPTSMAVLPVEERMAPGAAVGSSGSREATEESPSPTVTAAGTGAGLDGATPDSHDSQDLMEQMPPQVAAAPAEEPVSAEPAIDSPEIQTVTLPPTSAALAETTVASELPGGSPSTPETGGGGSPALEGSPPKEEHEGEAVVAPQESERSVAPTSPLVEAAPSVAQGGIEDNIHPEEPAEPGLATAMVPPADAAGATEALVGAQNSPEGAVGSSLSLPEGSRLDQGEPGEAMRDSGASHELEGPTTAIPGEGAAEKSALTGAPTEASQVPPAIAAESPAPTVPEIHPREEGPAEASTEAADLGEVTAQPPSPEAVRPPESTGVEEGRLETRTPAEVAEPSPAPVAVSAGEVAEPESALPVAPPSPPNDREGVPLVGVPSSVEAESPAEPAAPPISSEEPPKSGSEAVRSTLAELLRRRLVRGPTEPAAQEAKDEGSPETGPDGS